MPPTVLCVPAYFCDANLLQVLDSLAITAADKSAAQPHASDWKQAVEAGDMVHSADSRGTGEGTTQSVSDSTGEQVCAADEIDALQLGETVQHAVHHVAQVFVPVSTPDYDSSYCRS